MSNAVIKATFPTAKNLDVVDKTRIIPHQLNGAKVNSTMLLGEYAYKTMWPTFPFPTAEELDRGCCEAIESHRQAAIAFEKSNP